MMGWLLLSSTQNAWGQMPQPESFLQGQAFTNEKKSVSVAVTPGQSDDVGRTARPQRFLSDMQLPDDLPVLVKAYEREKQSVAGNPSAMAGTSTAWHRDLRKPFQSWPPWIKQLPQQKESLYLRNEHSGFWRKAGRGELLIGGVEVIGMVTLILMPKEVTKWEDDWMKAAGRNLRRAFTSPPVMDEDDWAINYIGHPIAGSYYYNAVRSQNATWWQSLLFSTAQSFIWEYVIEGVAEQPSIQDLIITPLAGMALGEPTHHATLAMRRNGFNFLEKVVVFLLNPMYVLNNGYKTPPAYGKIR